MMVRKNIKKFISVLLVLFSLVMCMPFMCLKNAEAGYEYNYVTGFRTSSSNSFPSEIYYSDSSGYSGYISKSGGSYVISGSAPRSKNVTDYRISSNNSFSSQVYYSDSSGYSGYINKSGSSYVISGSPADSKYVTGISPETIRRTDWYVWTGSGFQWDHTWPYTGPKPMEYSSGAYSGTLWRTNIGTGNFSYYTLGPEAKAYIGKLSPYCSYNAYYDYRGTITKPDTRVWRQNYSGTVSTPDTRVWRQNYAGYVSKYIPDPVVTSIITSPSSVDIRKGDTAQLSVTAQFDDGTSETVTSSASYSSSNTTVATVSTGGLVTGKAIGTATITVTYSGKTATVPVSVRKPDVEWITLTSDKTVIRKGGTAQLTVTAHLSDETTRLVTGSASFESSDPSMATVSGAGLVKGINKGKPTITASYAGKSDSITIEVRPQLYIYIRTLQ
jgi:hypothetical protein